jgi:hypothetical protein
MMLPAISACLSQAKAPPCISHTLHHPFPDNRVGGGGRYTYNLLFRRDGAMFCGVFRSHGNG